MKRTFLHFACAVVTLGVVGCGSSSSSGLFGSYDGSFPTDASNTSDGSVDSGKADGGHGDGGNTENPDAAHCYELTFVSPNGQTTLSDSADDNSDCSDGVTTTVVVATNAPEGVAATLRLGATAVGQATVSGALLTFSGVTLDNDATNRLTIELGDVEAGCHDSAHVDIDVACAGGPTCAISKPVISATHPKLNGEPAPGGDRVSDNGSNYQIALEVTTNAENGQLVTLQVGNNDTAAVAAVQNGVASFAGVQMTPDGDFAVTAHCQAASGKKTDSQTQTFTVDTEKPEMTVSAPSDGQHFGPDEDADPATAEVELDVCVTTTSADALDLPATLGTAQDNFCVAIGNQAPTCVPATASAGANACVRVTCPGSAPFDLGLSLHDGAGNVATDTVSAVTCASTKPSVQIISPASGTVGTVSTHLLAASSLQALKDQDAVQPLAQYTVVACTSSQAGTAVLMGGQDGGTLTQIAGPVTLEAAAGGDGCPAGLTHVARFTNATIPDSNEEPNGTLTTMTGLRVDVTDVSTEVGSSGNVLLWVDSTGPNLTLFDSTPKITCGGLLQTASAEDIELVFASPYDVNVTVTPEAGTAVGPTLFPNNGNLTQPVSMPFALGVNSLTAVTAEPSGNVSSLPACDVTLGNPPIVAWNSPPANNAILNLSTDGNAAAGWQGTLQVTVSNLVLANNPGASVTFKVNGVGIGTVPIQNDGTATLANAQINDGTNLTITASTSDTDQGVGSASLKKNGSTSLIVDTIAPDAVTAQSFTVLNRRETSFRLQWTAPADNGAAVAGYQVRVHTAAITAANFDDVAVGKVTFSGAAGAPGATGIGTNINNRLIEKDYYAAVRSVDAAGNVSAVVSVGPLAAHFNTTVLPAISAGEGFGSTIDGLTSLNGDARSDLIVGTEFGNKVYIWYAPATGDAVYSGAPNVTITGATNTGFGSSVASVGDINGDGLEDIVVGAPNGDSFRGVGYIFLQPVGGWPGSVGIAGPNVVSLSTNAADATFDFSFLGTTVGRMGDFDGDGVNDVGVGLPGYNGTNGYLAVVRGSSTLAGSLVLPDDVGVDTGAPITAILGESTAGSAAGWFGYPFVGIGPFYSLTGNSGNTVVVSAFAGEQGGTAPALYTLRGNIGNNGTLLASDAEDKLAGSTDFGEALALLGTFSGTPAIGVGAPSRLPGVGGQGQSMQGQAVLFFGSAGVSPFANVVNLTNSNSSSVSEDRFGTVIIGSAIPGSTVQGSFIGSSSVADIALAGSKENGVAPTLYFLSGDTARALVGQTVDVVTVADTSLALGTNPALANWKGTAPSGAPAKDINGDGFMDLVIGEYDRTFTPASFDGRAVIIW